MPPVLPAGNEKRESYWGAILEYLDAPDYVSKNRTKSAVSSRKRRINTGINLDPIISEPTQPIKKSSPPRETHGRRYDTFTDVGFDVSPDGLFTNLISKPDSNISLESLGIIGTETGTNYGTKEGDSRLSSMPIGTAAKGIVDSPNVYQQTGTENSGIGTNISETGTEISGIGTEMLEIRTEISGIGTEVFGIETNTSETGTEISEIETKTSAIETEISETETEEPEPTFLELLRDSNWMKMGDPRKKKVQSRVISQIGKQVYVDYGHKFYGAFKVPEGMEPSQFQTGTMVLVRVNDLELTQHFLGEEEMFSLLESGIEFVSLSTH